MWSSGASPGLIAGTSDFPPREGIPHNLNGRSWLPVFWQVAEGRGRGRGEFKFSAAHNCILVIFGRCAFVGVFVICLSLVLWGCRCPEHETAVYFWLCYAGVCLIMVFNKGKGLLGAGAG